MTAYWADHYRETIVWSIVGLLLLIFVAWCFRPKIAITDRLPQAPAIVPQMHPNIDDVGLAPLPPALLRDSSSCGMLPLPRYEERGRDVLVTDHIQLEMRDGYSYPKDLREVDKRGW